MELVDQPMIEVARLKPDPDNPRHDLKLKPSFVAGIKRDGVEVPLIIRPDPDDPGMCWIVEGHRRWRAACKAGLTHVPYRLATGTTDVDRFLTMYRTNADDHRINHTPREQARALFNAHQAGATRTEIRQRAGLSADQLCQYLKAGRLSDETVGDLHQVAEQWTVTEYALMEEFADDEPATEQLLRAKRFGRSMEHEAATIRQQRADQIAHRRLRAQLDADGIAVTDELPHGAVKLSRLRVGHPGQGLGAPLTDEQHTECPGHGVYFPSSLTEPVAYCTDPIGAGHGFLDAWLGERLRLRAELAAQGLTVLTTFPDYHRRLERLRHDGQELTADNHRHCPGAQVYLGDWQAAEPLYACADPDQYGHTQIPSARGVPAAKPPQPAPPRSLVIEANQQWTAASKLRREFLRQLGRRKTVPKDVFAQTVGLWLAQPGPLVRNLKSRAAEQLFTEFTGKSFAQAAAEAVTASSGRLQVLLLALLAAALEVDVAGDGERRNTWRTDGQTNPFCTRDEGQAYLKLPVACGYEASDVEQAVIDGVPYTGQPSAADVLIDQTPTDSTQGAEPTECSEGTATTTAQTGGDLNTAPVEPVEPAGSSGGAVPASAPSTAPPPASSNAPTSQALAPAG
ncbi:ParB/RepB/Spo0J family partition protein [Actinomadura kijaniata]|uniref:ParB/RepB/Spo0J family partition protein n=1 Tax=Actinomadura kijaniata TaxID=46161 RepID=UPI003F1A59C6